MAFDPKTRFLALATATGAIVFLVANKDEEWKSVNDKARKKNPDVPALAIDLLQRG